MNMVIIYTTPNNGIAILTPAPSWSGSLEELANKDIPSNATWKIVSESEIPSDTTFISALRLENNEIVTDINIAKEIWIDKFRSARTPLLAALDISFMRAVEAGDADLQKEIASKKQALRDVTSIELPNTLEGIKATWPEVLK